MKNFLLFPVLLILFFSIQFSFAQKRSLKKKLLKPSIKVINCYKCNDFVISLPNPKYPKSIGHRADKWTGTISVEVKIDEKGAVEYAKAVSGHPLFRPIVEKTALLAKFEPKIIAGDAVKNFGVIVYEITPANYKRTSETKIINLGTVNRIAKDLPKPNYPAQAKDSCADGQVEVEVLISKDGNVIEAKAVSGDELLRDSAVEAAKKAKFEEYGHIPSRIKGNVIYNFVTEQKCVALGIVNTRALKILKPQIKSIGVSNQEQTVEVKIVVDESGKVIYAKAISGHPMLRAACEISAKQAKFAPLLINPGPLKVKALLVYKFKPNGKIEF